MPENTIDSKSRITRNSNSTRNLILFILVVITLLTLCYLDGVFSITQVVMILGNEEMTKTIGKENVSIIMVNVIDKDGKVFILHSDEGHNFSFFRRVSNNAEKVKAMKIDGIYILKVLPSKKIISIDIYKRPQK